MQSSQNKSKNIATGSRKPKNMKLETKSKSKEVTAYKSKVFEELKRDKKSTKEISEKANSVYEKLPEIPDGKDMWIVTNELNTTRATQNYFQIERDRIVAFWEITKKQIEDVKSQLQEREQEKAELINQCSFEIQFIQQKMRHLLYEQNAHMETLKEEGEHIIISKRDEFSEEERLLQLDAQSVAQINSSTRAEHRTQLLELASQQDKEIAEQQNEFEHEVKEIQFKYEREMRMLREQMDESRREELLLISKRKEDHIAELCTIHERTYQEMKKYYSEITSNNLELIRNLKDEVYARRRTDAHNAKAMREVAQKNKKLTNPLERLEKEKKQLSEDVQEYAKDKTELDTLKRTVVEIEQTFKSLNWEHEVLFQRYTKLVEDRDCILTKFNKILQKIEQKSIFRRVLIEKKLEIVQNQLESKEAKLTELLKRANISAEDLKIIEQKIHDLLLEKDKTIEELESLLSNMNSRGDDVVNTYESYLQSNGISGLATSSEHRLQLKPSIF